MKQKVCEIQNQKWAKHKSKVCKKQIKESHCLVCLFTCTVRTIWGLGGAQVKVPLSSVASYQIFLQINNCISFGKSRLKMDKAKSLKCKRFKIPGDRWRIQGQRGGLMGEVGDPEQKLTLTRHVPTCVGLTIAYWMDYKDPWKDFFVNLHLINLISADQPGQLICWGKSSWANPAQM